jgi:cysteine synthase A
MTDEEVAIAKSTPNFRFDVPPPPTPAAPSMQPTPEAAAFVEAAISDRAQPVLVFALEWCEFCWSLRKLFAAAAIPYRAVDLDSAAYQKHDRGGQIRAVLREKTGSKTIPQVFCGGEFIGGCTETMESFKAGRLQALLRQHGVTFDETARVEPHKLLPGWLHPR